MLSAEHFAWGLKPPPPEEAEAGREVTKKSGEKEVDLAARYADALGCLSDCR